MKSTVSATLLYIILACAMPLASCTMSENSGQVAATKKQIPKVGMTMDQVRAIAGKPRYTSNTGDALIWSYPKNEAMHALPFYGTVAGYHANTVSFRNGRAILVDWSK